jgi:TNF receptor-associated protein 1
LYRYAEWYAKLGVFIKEWICGDQSYLYKDSLVPLLRFETSLEAPAAAEEGGKKKAAQVSLDEYVERMPAGQRDIYYLAGLVQVESS